jgi:hypothetical protein
MRTTAAGLRKACRALMADVTHAILPRRDHAALKKLFIVSTGRTGTEFLARFFGLFEGVYAGHEPYPEFFKLGCLYARGRVSREQASRRLERGRRTLFRQAERAGAHLYVEANNRLFSLLCPLRDAFPDARIVHIVRDGRDYVRSGMARDWYTAGDKFASQRLQATMFPDDPCRSRWPEMSRFEKIAWLWQKRDGFLYRDIEGLDNTMRVRFEDVFYNPDRGGLFRMTRFAGLPDEEARQCLERMADQQPNRTVDPTIPGWREWPSDMKGAFDKIAGHHLRLYYE